MAPTIAHIAEVHPVQSKVDDHLAAVVRHMISKEPAHILISEHPGEGLDLDIHLVTRESVERRCNKCIRLLHQLDDHLFRRILRLEIDLRSAASEQLFPDKVAVCPGHVEELLGT